MYMLCTFVIFLYFKKFRIITFGIRDKGLGVPYMVKEPQGVFSMSFQKEPLGGYLVYESIH